MTARIGRPPIPPERRRTAKITVMFTAAEHAALQAVADARGTTISSLVRLSARDITSTQRPVTGA